LCEVISDDSFGGIIHVDGEGEFNITKTEMKDCSADVAGGIYIDGVNNKIILFLIIYL
jgi:hypothetical protein